ncbi:MAG: Ni/Fe hydrogenase subunit alpha [Coriobacteriia bacterium]|nr:Ni/Fe hydrogenase subunit alpha [Coriobacteriia bacterium]
MSSVIRLAPIKRVEGHGTISIHLGDDGRVADAHFNSIEFRGFEKLVEGRMIWEMPLVTSRICGICPVSHHLAAVKAAEDLLGVTPPKAGVMLRELMHTGGLIQDHALHFFFLAGPDFLTGDGASRDLLGVLGARPDLAKRAIGLRKLGQGVVEAVGGQAGHPVTAIPGGVTKPLDPDVRKALLAQARAALPEAVEAERLARQCTLRLIDENDDIPVTPTRFLAQTRDDGTLGFYDGTVRIVPPDGLHVAEFPASDFRSHIAERIVPWSYAKMPYIRELGEIEGSYRVGPLARTSIVEWASGPLSDAALADFRQELGRPVQHPLAYHWARMIELLAAVERLVVLLSDDEIISTDVRVKVERRAGCGAAAVEAPRGTLFHYYEADEVGRVTKAELVVATTQNNAAINEAVRAAADGAIADGRISDGALRRMEVGIRAYDPCLSCSTHEIGRMPLVVRLYGPGGVLLDQQGVSE